MITLDQLKPVTRPYDQVRPRLRHGDVLLASGCGVFSAMIQQATNSPWSHVGLILRLDKLDRIMLLESVESVGVRTVPLSKYVTDYAKGRPYPGRLAIIRHKLFAQRTKPRTNPQAVQPIAELARYAVDQFGYPYDKDDIARIAARIMASRIPFTAQQRRRIKPDKEFICSEYVAQCLATIGLQIPWDQLGFIAPSHFAADPHFHLLAAIKS